MITIQISVAKTRMKILSNKAVKKGNKKKDDDNDTSENDNNMIEDDKSNYLPTYSSKHGYEVECTEKYEQKNELDNF